MFLEIGFMALIGAIIGWITNVLAIKMLFRPFNPYKIPFINIEIQGLIPKRRNEIARSIGETVENELVSINDIIGDFLTEESKKDIAYSIKAKVLRVIETKIPSIVPNSIKNIIMDYIKEQLDNEGELILNNTIESFIKRAEQEIKIGDIVQSKINEFDLLKIEGIILNISGTELKHIEILGGVLGFIIGIVQGLIIQLI